MMTSESMAWKELSGRVRRAIPQPDSKKSGVDFIVARWGWPRAYRLMRAAETEKGELIDDAVEALYARFPDLNPTHPRRLLSIRLSEEDQKAYDTVGS